MSADQIPARERAELESRLAAAEARAGEAERAFATEREQHITDIQCAERRLMKVEAMSAASERWRVAVAEGLGYINRAEGQAGYEIAEPRVIVDAFRAAESRAERAERTLAEAKAVALSGPWGIEEASAAVLGLVANLRDEKQARTAAEAEAKRLRSIAEEYGSVLRFAADQPCRLLTAGATRPCSEELPQYPGDWCVNCAARSALGDDR